MLFGPTSWCASTTKAPAIPPSEKRLFHTFFSRDGFHHHFLQNLHRDEHAPSHVSGAERTPRDIKPQCPGAYAEHPGRLIDPDRKRLGRLPFSWLRARPKLRHARLRVRMHGRVQFFLL